MNEIQLNNNMESESDVRICKICHTQPQKYLCPKCGIAYCSVACYKAEVHLECSESFYKKCVEEELKLDEHDPETKRRMLEVLQRMHEEHAGDMEEIEDLAHHGLDSDDDEEAPDLSQRLQNINLDDADSVWAALTDAERQEFETLLQNGEAEKLLPLWKPWWSFHAEPKLVEDLSPTSSSLDYRSNCPKLKEITPYDQISKVPPAKCVRNNVLNVLHAYTFTVLYFNGNHHDFAEEAIFILLQLCNNLRENEVFNEPELAIESVSQRAINCQSLIADSENLSAAKSACLSILRGPENSNKSFYAKVAFSDIHQLFMEAKTLSKREKPSNNMDEEFTKRFPDHGKLFTAIPREKLRLHLKKLEYYLSWINSYGKDLDFNF